MHKSINLRDPSWGLAWSNPAITDEVLIRKALLTERFSVILQACLDFGIDRVREQWAIISQEPELMSSRTCSLVGDILGNISTGFSQARD